MVTSGYLRHSLTAAVIVMTVARGAHALAADKMDLASSTLVIEKLTRSIQQLDQGAASDLAKVDLQLRLADVYAERARIFDIQQIEKSCETCTNAHDDRKSALSLYGTAVTHVAKENKGKVIMQMAHLDVMNGEIEKAKAIYEDVTRNSKDFSSDLVGEAYTGLGEYYFNRVKFELAMANYARALSIDQTPRKGYVTYRLAWCYFHEDRLGTAIATMVKVLKTPEFFIRGQDGKQDTSFREEASRDLATFLSRSQVGPNEVQTLSSLSPDNTRLDNLSYLAGELDRLGKKSSSIYVWSVIGDQRKDEPKNQLDNHLRLAHLQYDVGRKDLASNEIEAAVMVWKKQGCGDADECNTHKLALHKFMTDWGKAEEKTPTPYLVKVYGAYISLFPEAEMNYWAAQAAIQLKMYPQAAAFFRSASQLAAADAHASTKGAASANDKAHRLFEGSLLGEIEVAELSKDAVLRDGAYSHYLELNPNGDKNIEVRYQKARILYDQGKHAEAAIAFREVALASGLNGTNANKEALANAAAIREKAADLALDSLVLAKDDEHIQPWAQEFAKTFTHRSTDYAHIARRAVLNKVVLTINNPQASLGDYQDSLNRLNALDMNDAPQNEKVAVLKNKIILAEKLENLGEVQKGAATLLAVKGLSAADHDFALSREEWASELTLNFPLAYSLFKQLKTPSLSQEDRLLKLALLAELAGQNGDGYYEQYLKVATDHKSAQAVMAKLIRHSSNPEKTFLKYEFALRDNAELTAELALEAFAVHHNYALADAVTKNHAVRATAAGQTLNRFVYVKDFNAFVKSFGKHHLDARSNGALKHSLSERIRILQKLETVAQGAVDSGDWTLQVVTLSTVAAENRRLAREISALPTPKALKKTQRAQYRQLIAQQALPYSSKASQIEAKVNELFNHEQAIVSGLSEEYGKAHGAMKALIIEEIKMVSQVNPKARELKASLSSAENSKPAAGKITEAKSELRADPFNKGKIERLRILESKAGSDIYVAYLDARLAHLSLNAANAVNGAEAAGVKK